MEVGQAINAVTGTRLWLLMFSFPREVLLYAAVLQRCPASVVQRFVHFSAHPQVMQQHCQLSRRGDDGSLLSALSAPFGQLQTPASQVAVETERSQNVLRSLHQ